MTDRKQKNSVPTQVRDINSKEIFKNPTLCSQFLRDNVDIPALKRVQPEDIEDVSEHFQAYFGVEFSTDTVKKIRLKDENGDPGDVPLFFISLIEHKSRVDHDIMMQLLRYMTCIWHEYAKEREQERPGITKTKSFRYPPILPLVYYEGSSRWTASQHLGDRIWHSDIFGMFVPDFRYEVVKIHDYSNEELLDRGDEMSLIMMLNKLQNQEDFRQFRLAPPQQLADMLTNADPHILEIVKNVMYSLMMKINIPVDEADNYVQVIGGNHMGYLFENMEKMDIQAERANTAEARKQAEEARRLADEAQKQADEAQKQANEAQKQADEAQKQVAQLQQEKETLRTEIAYQSYITACRDFSCTKEAAARKFAEKFQTSLADDPQEALKKAYEKVNQYWDEA